MFVYRNGVGRTGMFQLIYVAMQEINHGQGIINIQEMAGKLMWKRRNLLLRQEQLKFCFEAVLYYAQDVLAKGRDMTIISLIYVLTCLYANIYLLNSTELFILYV